MDTTLVLPFEFFFLALTLGPVSGESCKSYCDKNNNYVNGFECETYPSVYCCGNKTNRYCCSDPSQDISDYYSAICMCPNTECIYSSNWQIMIGSIMIILAILAIILCCCNACFKSNCCPYKPRRSRARNSRVGSQEIQSVSSSVENTTDLQTGSQIFNPSHPFAFAPPAYETLDKDLPKYDDICSSLDNPGPSGYGQDNVAFSPDEQQGTSNTQQASQSGNIEENQMMGSSQEVLEQHLSQQHPNQQQSNQQPQQQQQQRRTQHRQQPEQHEERSQQENSSHPVSEASEPRQSRVIIVMEREDSFLGPPQGSPPGSPPPPYRLND